MNYQDGSYIKVRNISLGYNFTPQQLKNLGINNLKLYVQAMNPFNIYKACDFLDTDLVNYDNNTNIWFTYHFEEFCNRCQHRILINKLK